MEEYLIEGFSWSYIINSSHIESKEHVWSFPGFLTGDQGGTRRWGRVETGVWYSRRRGRPKMASWWRWRTGFAACNALGLLHPRGWSWSQFRSYRSPSQSLRILQTQIFKMEISQNDSKMKGILREFSTAGTQSIRSHCPLVSKFVLHCAFASSLIFVVFEWWVLLW